MSSSDNRGRWQKEWEKRSGWKFEKLGSFREDAITWLCHFQGALDKEDAHSVNVDLTKWMYQSQKDGYLKGASCMNVDLLLSTKLTGPVCAIEFENPKNLPSMAIDQVKKYVDGKWGFEALKRIANARDMEVLVVFVRAKGYEEAGKMVQQQCDLVKKIAEELNNIDPGERQARVRDLIVELLKMEICYDPEEGRNIYDKAVDRAMRSSIKGKISRLLEEKAYVYRLGGDDVYSMSMALPSGGEDVNAKANFWAFVKEISDRARGDEREEKSEKAGLKRAKDAIANIVSVARGRYRAFRSRYRA